MSKKDKAIGLILHWVGIPFYFAFRHIPKRLFMSLFGSLRIEKYEERNFGDGFPMFPQFVSVSGRTKLGKTAKVFYRLAALYNNPRYQWFYGSAV